MRKLLALGAVAGLAATTYRVDDADARDAGARARPKQTSTDSDAGDASAAGEAAAADAAADAAPDALRVVFDPESRYGVVDPLPPPQPAGCGCRKTPEPASRR